MRTPTQLLSLLLLLTVWSVPRSQSNPQSATRNPQSNVSPQRPVLVGDVAEKVAELEERIAELRKAGLSGDDKAAQDASLAEAIELAEQVLAIRQEHQTGWTNADGTSAEWYEVGDARRVIEDLRRFGSLTPEQRAELEEADKLAAEEYELYQRGKYAEAAELQRRQLEIHRGVLGDEHPRTLGSINDIGYLLNAKGKPTEAEPYYREALEGRRRVLGDDHPDMLSSVNNMGMLLQDQGKLAEAEPYLRDALEGRRRVLGDDHPETLTSINNMGYLLGAQGRLAEAEPYYRQALEGRRRVLGDDHPDTLTSINNIGMLLHAQGKVAEAETLFAAAAESAGRSLPEGHWHTGVFRRNHGNCLAELERYAEAETALLEAHEIFVAALGAEHERMLGAIESLAGLYEAWGKPDQSAEWRAKLPATSEDPSADDGAAKGGGPATSSATSQPAQEEE